MVSVLVVILVCSATQHSNKRTINFEIFATTFEMVLAVEGTVADLNTKTHSNSKDNNSNSNNSNNSNNNSSRDSSSSRRDSHRYPNPLTHISNDHKIFQTKTLPADNDLVDTDL